MDIKLDMIDPTRLRRQTECLRRLQEKATPEDTKLLEGVSNLLEAIQDQLDGVTPTITVAP